MAVAVIGSGLDQTRTKSLQTALAMLGWGPCHHMVEVFKQPESMGLWIAAGNGQPDWDAIFAGYRSAVDYPRTAHWRALVDYYPQAKVIHTVRDADAWFESTQATIFSPDGATVRANGADERSAFFKSFSAAVDGHLHDHAFLTDYFHRHTQEVIATISPERLLIYEVGQGWVRFVHSWG